MTPSKPNPFESSPPAGNSNASPVGTPGPWRDGSYLVLHPYETNLPAICVKTGLRQGVVVDSYTMPFHSSDADYGEFTLKIDIPLSKSYSRTRAIIGLVVPLLTCVLGCSGMLVWIGDSEAIPKPVIAVLGIVGMALPIVGVAFAAWWLCRQPLIPIGTRRPYIWLKGACPAFLEELPPLPESICPNR
jgi:hypothetical protein